MNAYILAKAIEQFNKISSGGVSISISQDGELVKDNKKERIVVVSDQGEKWIFQPIIKSKIVPSELPSLLEKITPQNLLVAEYITPEAKNFLRKRGCFYLDTRGNANISQDSLFVYIETGESNRTQLDKSNIAFYKSGLQVVLQFLIRPDALNMPYRKIGAYAGVSIRTVEKVIKGLLKEREIIQVEPQYYKFTNREQLFFKWVDAFNQNLRPKIFRSRVKFVHDIKYKDKPFLDDSYWGGGIGAEILTQTLQSVTGTLYSNKEVPVLVKKLGILPDPEGEIFLLKNFGDIGYKEGCVDPMIIYADLINDLSGRNEEVSKSIFENYVKNRL